MDSHILLKHANIGWNTGSQKGVQYWFWRGSDANMHLLERLQNSDVLSEGDISILLKENRDFGSGVLKNDTFTLAWVDHIRAKPLFYASHKGALHISDNARALRETLQILEVNDRALVELSMAGYISGADTFYTDIKTLQPGEFLICSSRSDTLHTCRYDQYTPNYAHSNVDNNKERLGAILDSLTKKIIQRADGRTIWVPLSAGLDSRILLCKLHEHGYKHIECFTYGPKYNFEAKYARRIAKALDIPWRSIVLPRDHLKDLFQGRRRQDFWNYADGLKAIPCMREFSAIAHLHDTKQALPGDIFINGQSGDFITGGHIPATWAENNPSEDDFYDVIIDQHFDLWNTAKTPKNYALIRSSILDILHNAPLKAQGLSESLCGAYEQWEYEARQVCYVANGQRVYEFFGFDWDMPLWERDLCNFFTDIPLEQKIGQSLYKAYLRDYNYYGLFPAREPYIWRWPLPMLWVVAAAKGIQLLKGEKPKADFYAKMCYHGHYANQYAFFDRSFHDATCRDTRNVISLYVAQWLKENMTEEGADEKVNVPLAP